MSLIGSLWLPIDCSNRAATPIYSVVQAENKSIEGTVAVDEKDNS
jgi:hypothetical protein